MAGRRTGPRTADKHEQWKMTAARLRRGMVTANITLGLMSGVANILGRPVANIGTLLIRRGVPEHSDKR